MNDPQKTLDNARKADNEEVIALVNDYIEKREMRRGGMHKLPVRDEKEKSEVGEMESNTEKPWWQFWKDKMNLRWRAAMLRISDLL
jgi:hypothetical protein